MQEERRYHISSPLKENKSFDYGQWMYENEQSENRLKTSSTQNHAFK